MSLVEEARTVRRRIVARLRELEPLVREYNELTQLAAEMGIEAGDSDEPSQPAPSVDEPTAPAPARKPARGRQAAGAQAGARAAVEPELVDRILDAVRGQPGQTVAEYAELLGISATALYRPVRELTNDGSVIKRARQLFPAE